MEEKKQVASSSSFTSELFGSKDSTSSTGIFGSIFAPPSKVLGRGLLRSEVLGKKQGSVNEAWNTKPGTPDDSSKSNHGEGQNVPSRDTNSFYQEQRVQPCHLSSSIYYGGQDIYHHPQNSQNSNMTSMFKKDGTEDDSGSASRGNWWQGSLYY
ncbi:uncharacterized protein LOC110623140 [Manihot esculenta]|uniref:Uncharacterized protein n=4 Tax=Manihot esculenta TaxID=3983 RepID=A0ACB7H4U6_MANES|nr:uncharacterized protein LOC110623140 [Manihot esculenta]KAG8647696.1 hypothetical protein MANES_09G098500v8 [Manihot esculenta]KAG8647697.1 hypothetical protein MANES_09G098500v8 [Manihot esculenta]KAG8647698.1 hypothetical protein MANES_09G098500v8 [Manihot esculenta]OAY41399.1 hypothetical protein MANES_09G098500v8 [Manihot esculenta]